MAPWRIAIGCVVILWIAPLARGQVIQLPTFHYFSIATSVLVPDRGTALLGGVDRAAYGSSTFGMPGGGPLFTNRGLRSDLSSSRAFASATIIDHGELDRAVLSAAAARRREPAGNPDIRRKAAFLNQHIARTGSRPGGDPSNGRRVATGKSQGTAPIK